MVPDGEGFEEGKGDENRVCELHFKGLVEFWDLKSSSGVELLWQFGSRV